MSDAAHETSVFPVRGLTPPQWRVICAVCGWLVRLPDEPKACEVARLHSERADTVADVPVARFAGGIAQHSFPFSS